jgi:pyruvate kinase
MTLPACKTKIVCTIGPASRSETVLERLISGGMNVARLNFAHGSLEEHKENIRNIRAMAAKLNRYCQTMVDLPGPKIRIGKLCDEPLLLENGKEIILTTEDIVGTAARIPVAYKRLPESVVPGSQIVLNDGFIQLRVEKVSGDEVFCSTIIGGPLFSRKGLHVPGAKIFADAVSDPDIELVDFALREGIDTFGVSFVETANDIVKVRDFARKKDRSIFVVAKIERAEAINNFDDILVAADAIMIARGDLGVQISLEDVPGVQKRLIRKANLSGRPVITATQMLMSMTENIRPTRAEVSDVANAILDGTDCVMLSEESAIGKFPVEAMTMLAKIATATEAYRSHACVRDVFTDYDRDDDIHLVDLVSRNVRHAVESLIPTAVIVPTVSGYTARMISRFRLPVWIAAVSPEEATCRALQFSYGVTPIHAPRHPEEWSAFARRWVRSVGLTEGLVVLTEGPSRNHPEAHPRLEIIDLGVGGIGKHMPSPIGASKQGLCPQTHRNGSCFIPT